MRAPALPPLRRVTSLAGAWTALCLNRLPIEHFANTYDYLDLLINYLLLCTKYMKVISALSVICDNAAISQNNVYGKIFTIVYISVMVVLMLMMRGSIFRSLPVQIKVWYTPLSFVWRSAQAWR